MPLLFGLSLLKRFLLLLPRLKPLLSDELLPITYAALCRAVAAADLRNACARASASFFAQSGRTISVVMTCGEFAESDLPLFLPPPPSVEVGGVRDDAEDIAEGWMV